METTNIIVLDENTKDSIANVNVVHHKFNRLSPYDFNVEDIDLGSTNYSGEIIISNLTEGDSVSFSKNGYLESSFIVKERGYGFYEPSNFEDGTIVTAKRNEPKGKKVRVFLHRDQN